ncbi:MAG: LPP20 family lipoprotein [Bacteroides sp.]|nr:LPP20 family lipoprotein [Roseburia sp.]MCM1347630.1 LPP20 family lipoprotein [Bacteroides sp.]MCM1422056.1 LPP20 family lipoprotein [Bacteroides sp.]
MKKSTLFLLLFLHVVGLPAQSFKENAKRAKEIQLDDKYICALGHGETLKQASNNALAALAGQISTSVESEFNYLLNDENKNGESTASAKVNSIIKTYSHTTLKNTLELVIEDEPKATVLRYILRKDLETLFEQRRMKVLEYASNAEKYEKEYKVADALSNYYAALALLRSLPDGSNMKIKLGYTDEQLLMPLISNSVNEILSNVTTGIESVENYDTESMMVVNFSYKGKPAANFNYTYFDGKQRSEICSAKDGIGEITIGKGFNLAKLDLHAEYICEDEANYDRELREVIDNTDPVPFRTAKLRLDKNKSMKTATTGNAKTAIGNGIGKNMQQDMVSGDGDVSPYLSIMQKIETAIRQKNYHSVRDCFTEEGFEMFTKLINYGHAKLLRAPVLKILQNGETVTCRSFPMSFSFNGNRRTFTEDVVFHLTQEGKVFEVAFGLSKQAVDDVMNRNAWDDNAKSTIINFLESYKTAYALKRLDYIGSIFSDNALIITGSIIRESGRKEVGPKNVEHVKYTRQTKEQYMKNLKVCFRSNEYVNIHFADNIIRRSAANPNIYGIQIKQNYYSSSYGDTGYLFLLIDLTDSKTPIIHVRTWQPDKDPNIEDGRIGMQDFII